MGALAREQKGARAVDRYPITYLIIMTLNPWPAWRGAKAPGEAGAGARPAHPGL